MANARSSMPSVSLLSEFLSYDPETGVFIWIKKAFPSGRLKVGDVAGYVEADGYRYIHFRGEDWKASRLAWLWVHGEPVPPMLDHENTKKSDDRICNLRPANKSQNGANRGPNKNSVSGVKGVYWVHSRLKWTASITVNYKTINLGRYDTMEEAIEAHRLGSLKAFGEFANLTPRSARATERTP